MVEPTFIKRYRDFAIQFDNITTQARINKDLYETLKIIQLAIKDATNVKGREGDISEVLNMYIDWNQFRLDAKEATEYLQKRNQRIIDNIFHL